MIPFIVNVLAFLAVFLAVFAVNAILADLRITEKSRARHKMEEQLRMEQIRKVRESTDAKDLGSLAAQAAAENKVKVPLGERLRLFVAQSGLPITVERLQVYSVASALMPLVLGMIFLGPLVGVILGLISGALPWLYVAHKRSKRIRRLREQLPEAFELMSRVLRAGQTMTQAMQAVGEEFSRPLSLEFLYCAEQMNLGLAPDVAFHELGHRTGIIEMRIFVLSVVVQRQTGGNMAELLDKLSHVVRERFRIRGMIDSLTAQGRFQAGILLSLPPAMFLLLLVLHWEYERTLFDYPMMIVTAVGMMAMGALWVRRIVNFDF